MDIVGPAGDTGTRVGIARQSRYGLEVEVGLQGTVIWGLIE
jgi:hypothetical protein